VLPSSLVFALHILIAIGLTVRLLYRKLAVSTTLGWIIILFALPYIGIFFYFLFGDHRMGRKRLQQSAWVRSFYQKRYGIEDDGGSTHTLEVSESFRAMSENIAQDSGFHVTHNNKVEVLEDAGEIIDRIVADIDAATGTCYLEFYIVEPEGRVTAVMEALVRAAKRGVDCNLLADHFGSKALFRSSWLQRLRQAGVDVEASLPVGVIKSLSQRTDLRNHRKLIAIDQAIGYVGSFNLVDPRLFKQDKAVGEWVDIMFRLEGHIVDSIGVVFNADYIFDTVGLEIDRKALRDLPTDTPTETAPGNIALQLLPSGPEIHDSMIHEWVVSAIFAARKRVSVITPYFIPDETLTLALKAARKRGVAVDIIVPERIDSRMAQFASESVFSELLHSDISISRYQDGLLHTKCILIDDTVSMVGTVNIDTRSFYLNLELTLIAYDKGFNARMDAMRARYLTNCTPLTLESWSARPKFRRLLENILRLAAPLL
jgi:cardiolipin synthase A/B